MNNHAASCDVLVVGAGPAGIAAAVSAAQANQRVILVDDNPTLGGQIWRGAQADSPLAFHWLQQIENHQSNIKTLLSTRVFYANTASRQVLAESADGTYTLTYRKLILTTGAREQFIPFSGWTLPNVTGVGGLQALVKGGLPIARKRVVIAGSGPLLLAAAAYLRKYGAIVPLIAEQASWAHLISFGVGLVEQPSKLWQALQLRRQLGRTPYRTGCWVTAAERRDRSLLVSIQQGQRTVQLECDYLACAYHLVPNPELALLLGCVVQDGHVWVNEYQETSQPAIYCAGESTGIGGIELALVEGQIAGYAASDQHTSAQVHFAGRTRLQHFADRLNHAFAPRAELKTLAAADTIVCRCEDVPLGRIQSFRSWRDAKLHTRCGMGPCQGRICGAALKCLLNWEVESIRPPVFPARVESLASGTVDPNVQ